MTVLGTSYLRIVSFCSSPGFCYPLTTRIPQLSERLFLSILEPTLTFEGEFRYLETTVTISEHSELGVTFVGTVLGIVERRCVMAPGRKFLAPQGLLFGGCRFAVRASGIKGERVMSMSQMYQKQMEKQSDFRCWIFNLFRMNLNSLDGQFESIWPNQWGLRKVLPDQVSGDKHTFPITSSSVALVAFFLPISMEVGVECYSWWAGVKDDSHGWRTCATFVINEKSLSFFGQLFPLWEKPCLISYLSQFSCSWGAPPRGWNQQGYTFPFGIAFHLDLLSCTSGPAFPTATFLALGSSLSRILWLSAFQFADQSS